MKCGGFTWFYIGQLRVEKSVKGDVREHVHTRCDWLITPICRFPPNSSALHSYGLKNECESLGQSSSYTHPVLGIRYCTKLLRVDLRLLPMRFDFKVQILTRSLFQM